MARHPVTAMAMYGALIGLILASTSVPARAQDPTQPPLDRQWYHHEELAADLRLRAAPHQSVILHLEPTGARGKPIRTVVPYHFRRTASWNFCVPPDDPHIRSLTLVSEASGQIVVHVPRGAPCKMRMVFPGPYRLHVAHDGTRVPASGAKAFLHVPRRFDREGDGAGSSVLEATTPSLMSTLPACGAVGSSFWASVDNPLFTLMVEGSYVLGASYPSKGTTTSLSTGPVADDPLVQGWSMCRHNPGTGFVVMFNAVTPSNIRQWKRNTANVVLQDTGACVTDSLCLFLPFDRGGNTYELSSDLNVIHSGTQLMIANAPAVTFTALYRVYRQGAQVPAPQAGEVQLLNAACGQAPAATFVSSADLPDLAGAGIRGFSNVIVRPGPGTAAVAYPKINHGGTPRYITEETCLNALPASLAIMPTTADFVASSNMCTHCDLTGVSLQGLNLSGGNFTGTLFNQGNLTNTDFQSAILDGAKFRSYQSEGGPTTLTGTNFLGAHLNCTDFQASDLRTAAFWAPGVIDLVITRDFSCRLQLQFATLSGTTFPLQDWRYLLLDGAHIVDISGQALSTTGAPLDLSKARMSGTSGLTHVGLAGANLSGASFTGTDLTGTDLGSVVTVGAGPANFNRAILTQAFMKNAQLSGSFFRGASMSPVNLAGADLSGAWLEDDGSGQFGPVNLARSYMQNTRLNGAHLTGAVLDEVSWYSKDPSAPTATAAGALLVGASLHRADVPGLDLTGAHLQGATLTDAQLIGANLTGAQLQPDGSRRTELGTANLRGAILNGTNLTSANLFDAGVATTQESSIFLEVLKDPDHFQQPPQYEYLAVNRPATVLDGATNTTGATCPNGALGPCGPLSDPRWVAPAGPQEPSCQATAVDADGNVIGISCSSDRHPAGG